MTVKPIRNATLRCNKSCATLSPIGSRALPKGREVCMSAVARITPATAAPKSLYELGEIPPLGHVPERMYAWAIRKDRHGPPEHSMQIEVVPTWSIADV